MNRFDDKVVIVTGAGSGLGQATALQLAKEGFNFCTYVPFGKDW